MTKLVTFDDSRLVVESIERRGDGLKFNLHRGSVTVVPARTTDVEGIDHIDHAEDGLHGTIHLKNGDTVALPLIRPGIAQEIAEQV